MERLKWNIIPWETVPVFSKRKIDWNNSTLRFQQSFLLNFHVFFWPCVKQGVCWDGEDLWKQVGHPCNVAWVLPDLFCCGLWPGMTPLPPTLRRLNCLPLCCGSDRAHTQQWNAFDALPIVQSIARKFNVLAVTRGKVIAMGREGKVIVVTPVTPLAASPPGCACLQDDHRRKIPDWIMFAQKPAVNTLGSTVRLQFVKCVCCDCSSNKSSADVFFM